MHEVSIAVSLLETVSQQCRRDGYRRIESINVEIGRASGIMPDALLFAFNAIKEDSPASDAVLNIREIPVAAECNACNRSFSVKEDFVLYCPLCGSTSFSIVAGREMDIIDMEVS